MQLFLLLLLQRPAERERMQERWSRHNVCCLWLSLAVANLLASMPRCSRSYYVQVLYTECNSLSLCKTCWGLMDPASLQLEAHVNLAPLINSHRNEKLSTDNCQRSVIVTARKAEREREPIKYNCTDSFDCMQHVLCTLHLSPFHAVRSLQSFPPLQLVVRTAYRIKRLTRCIYIYIYCVAAINRVVCLLRALAAFSTRWVSNDLFFPLFCCLFMFTSLLLLLLLLCCWL
jgi:hypothetical protein